MRSLAGVVFTYRARHAAVSRLVVDRGQDFFA
jgi:hypothetical protein